LTEGEDEEGASETQSSLPPTLPPAAIPVEVNATAAPNPHRPTKTRVAVAAAMLSVAALQLAWIAVLVFWIVHTVW
jgi:hypothetical protein